MYVFAVDKVCVLLEGPIYITGTVPAGEAYLDIGYRLVEPADPRPVKISEMGFWPVK